MPSRVRMQRFLNIRPDNLLSHDEASCFTSALSDANRTRLKLAHRVVVTQHFYEWFKERFAAWQESLSHHTSANAKQHLWQLIQTLEEMATAFKIIVAQAEESNPENDAIPSSAILRALEIHVLIMRLLTERYQEVPGRLWTESYALYHIARNHNFALRAQTSGTDESVCIQQVFIQLVLIGMIDAYRQSPGLFPWIVAYLYRYAAALPLYPYKERPIPLGADSLPGLFLIDLHAERAPLAPWHMDPNHPLIKTGRLAQCLILDATPLEALIPEHLRLLSNGEDPALIHPTLAHLPASQRQELLEQIWSSLLPDARGANRKDMWGIPLRIQSTPQEVMAHLRYAQALSQQPLDMTSLTQSKEITSDDRHEDCLWRLMDISSTGMRIACINAEGTPIEVGAIIGLETEKPEDALRAQADISLLQGFSIVQVRWLRQALRGGIHMGLRKLGDAPQLGHVRIDAPGKEPYTLNCILLKQGKQSSFVIFGQDDIATGTPLQLENRDNGNPAQRTAIRIVALLTKTRHFRQYAYALTPQTGS